MLHRHFSPTVGVLLLLASFVLVVPALGQDKPQAIDPDAAVEDTTSDDSVDPESWEARVPDLKASFVEQLRADRAAIYAMSREERQQYVAQGFQSPDRATRRAFKEALEVVRPEWDIVDEPPEPSADKRGGRATKALGPTIAYDTGTVFGTTGLNSQMVGNRFNSAAGQGIETSGTVTQITFEMVNTFFGSAVWSLYSNIMGTTANQVTSKARPGIMTGLNTLTVHPDNTNANYLNGTFLAGIWQFDRSNTALAVDTGTTNGQGFHGISNNDGAMATGITTITNGGMGLNAIFRVSGNVITPIELMDFSIEDEESDGND